jgi:hypothetical protein
MEPATFEELQQILEKSGPDAALERLSSRLRESQDYEGLFYSRLLAARHRLGVSPIPTGPAAEIPDDKQEAYEDAIRLACREVGQLHLRQGNLGQAYSYFRMIGDTGPVRQALADHTPDDNEDMDALVRISLYEGLLPRKGFDWVLDRFGICSAITTLGGQQLPLSPEDRRYCVGRIVRNLYEDLCDRVAADIENREGKAPEVSRPHRKGTLRKLLAGRDSLFGEDAYHIDLSHLSSTVQMSLDLEPGEDMELARELCIYGMHLSDSFKNRGEPPFDEPYKDHDVYLAILMGENVEAGLAHFRAKADVGTDEVGTGPAEVLIQLLKRLVRLDEALEVARKHLARADDTWLSYITDLCRRANDYRVLAEAARENGNAVQFLAGLLASRK